MESVIKVMRVALIGPGDIKFHYSNLLGLKREDFEKEIRDIAQSLVNWEILLLPDRGVSFEVAKNYKEMGGKKIIGTVPMSDKDFGIKHLKPYLEAVVNGRRVFDEVINTDNWYKQDLVHCIFGDVVLMLGNSLGSLGELVYGYYLYKLFVGDKPEVKAKRERIHPQIRAGINIPFSTFIYKPFFHDKLNYEIEAYIKKLGGQIFYVENSTQLEQTLRALER